MPRIHTLDPTVRDNAVRTLLRDVGRLDQQDAGFREALKQTACVPTGSGSLAKPGDLYDPGVTGLRSLLGDECFPSSEFSRTSMLLGLRSLGLRSELTRNGVLRSATSVEALAEAGDDEAALARARQLLRFLDLHSDSVLNAEAEADAEPEPGELPVAAFSAQLRRVAWLPALTQPAADKLPWRPVPHSAVAAPSATRPVDDMWLCSFQKRVLDGEVVSHALRECFGWDEQVDGEAAAAQLLQLAADPPPRAKLATVVPKLYEVLDGQVGTARREAIVAALRDRDWIWVGDGDFVSAGRVALEAPANTKPYLHEAPAELRGFAALLDAFGVREAFAPADYADVLQRLAGGDGGGEDDEPARLSGAKLQFAVGMAKLAATATDTGGAVVVPTENGELRPAGELVYDDAPWLSATVKNQHQLTFLHPEVPHEAAAALGVQSLRQMLLSDRSQQAVAPLPCPSAGAVRDFVGAAPAGLQHLLTDLLEVADRLGCAHVDVLLDQREHAKESLVDEGMAPLQGPALVLRLRDTVLSTEQTVQLVSALGAPWQQQIFGKPNGGTRHFQYLFGRGLSAAFHVADVVQVLSADLLCMFDPAALHLSPSSASSVEGADPTATPRRRSRLSFSGRRSSSSSSLAPAGAAGASAVADEVGVEDGGIPVMDGSLGEKQRPPATPEAKVEDVDGDDVGEVERKLADDEARGADDAPVGRWFKFRGSDLASRFPDQFKPFTELPFGFDLEARGQYHDTILRVPLRRRASRLSRDVLNPQAADHWLRALTHVAPSCLLFTNALEHLSVQQWDREASRARTLCSASIRDVQSVRARRAEVALNKEWRKKFKLSNLIKGGFTPFTSTYTIDLTVSQGDDDPHMAVDTYLVSSALGYGSCKDLALSQRFETVGLTPVASVAAHLLRNAQPAPRLSGGFFCGLPLRRPTGLPVHLNACFLLSAGERAVELSEPWNADALKSGVVEAYEALLLEARGRAAQLRDPDERSAMVYNMWPSFNDASEELRRQLLAHLLPRLASKDLYLAAQSGQFMRCSDGYFQGEELPASVQTFAQAQFPLFRVPAHVASDFAAVSVQQQVFTPAVLRRFLRTRKDHGATVLSAGGMPLCHDLLRFCLSDAPPGAELRGLHIVPLASSEVGCFSPEHPLLLASERQAALVPSLSRRIVAASAKDALPAELAELGVQPFDARVLAGAVHEVLPPEWRGKTFVQWDGQAPAPQWLAAFWQEVSLADPVAVELFREWPLVPLATGELLSCGAASMACAVWHDASRPSFRTSSGGEEGEGEDWPLCGEGQEALHQLLADMRVPLLELGYFDPSAMFPVVRMAPLVLHALTLLRDEPCPSYLAHAPEEYEPRLRWGQGEEGKEALLRVFAVDMMPNGGYTASEREALRALPIFENALGQHVPMTADFFLMADDVDLPLPDAVAARCLRPRPELRNFFVNINAEPLTLPNVVLRHVLPAFGELAPADQDAVMEALLARWQTLTDYTELVNAVRELPFVGGKRAAELFDPRNELLAAVFAASAADRFPQGKFAAPEWLALLGDVGLRSAIDADVFLECASADDLSVEMATKLGLYLIQHFNELYSPPFCRQLAQTAFVPVDGRLLRFCDAAVPADRALVWSVMPVLPEVLVPPQVMWGDLQVESPPAVPVVLQHVERLTQDPALLEQCQPSAVDVFQRVYGYLAERWESIGAAHKARLRELPVVPVGHRLVKASRLYIRLTENLAPFMFEVPRAFGAYDGLLQALGTTAAPTARDYVVFLAELRQECGASPLNPTELSAVLRVARLLSTESRPDAGLDGLWLPDRRAVLVRAADCLFDDAPWITARARPEQLQLAHPALELGWCRRLGLSTVSESVSERLDPSHSLAVASAPEAQQLTRALQSDAVFGALRQIAGADDADDVERRLRGYTVCFVQELHSQFWRALPDGTAVNVTREATGSLSFLDRASRTIYVAIGALPAAVRPAQVLARAINQLLGGRIPDTTALACVLESDDGDVGSVLGLLRVSTTSVDGGDSRGVPGAELVGDDRRRLEFKPTRMFFPGEIVGIGDMDVDGDGVMRYATVVSAESADDSSGVARLVLQVAEDRTEQVLSSNVFSFKPTTVETAGATEEGSGSGDEAERVDLASVVVSVDDDPVEDEAEAEVVEEKVQDDVLPVSQSELVTAVNSILARAGMSLSLQEQQLMTDNLRMRSELDAAQEQLASMRGQLSSVADDKQQLKDSLSCQICVESAVDCVLTPCGHVICSGCEGQLQRRKCPFCRQGITGRVPFFLPA